MRTILLSIATAALTVTAVPAFADDDDDRRWRGEQRASRYYTSDNGVRYWRGNDGRYYCKRSNGTTGLIVGGAVGALAGRAIDTNGDRATGTILGAAAGALLGREVARGPVRCR